MALIDVNWKPGGRDLRIFALLFLIFAGLAGLLAWRDGSVLVAKILWGAAAAIGITGQLIPRLVWPVYVVMMAVALPVGMVVSTVLMTAIFYLVVTPLGLVMRIIGYDPMGRRPQKDRASYWIEREGKLPTSRYFRQY